MHTHNTTSLARLCCAVLLASLAIGVPARIAAAQAAKFGEWEHDEEKHDWGGFKPHMAALLPSGEILMWNATGGGVRVLGAGRQFGLWLSHDQVTARTARAKRRKVS